MPLYQYKCKKCKTVEDIYSSTMVTSSDDPVDGSKCPTCDKGIISRVVSLPNAIVRAGGAWATAIRKDQIGFSEMDVGDSISKMNANKHRS
tara:strand:+ start:544 stop:816 length:273 start_codon:yes stop_codon:yes gene_type:complete